MGILIFFLAIGILIAFHELGHFLFAKFFGVQVDVFSVGFGPKIISRKIGKTEYCISAIPLGGYVKLAGELESKNNTKDPAWFTSKSKWQQLLVYLAGPLFSILLGFLIYVFSNLTFGAPTPDSNVVTVVQQNSPAERAGIKPGDKIVKIGNYDVRSPEKIISAIKASSPDEEVGIKIRGSNEEVNISLKPTVKNNIPWLGIGVNSEVTRSPVIAVTAGSNQFKSQTALILSGLGQIFSGKIRPKDSLMGPIGIAQLSNQISSTSTWPVLFNLWAILTINLGIFNLFPVPGLDGGHIGILALEIVSRKSFSQQVKIRLLYSGLFLIITLMVFVIYLDISRLFK